ncbi:MAG: hypothetical protein HY876_10780 [Coriobacteriales bacterium]|nr:hypothetical protein [Coriobacteriales bacterium]
MRFTPFNLQAPLAAGGVTLMAFNWLQFAVPHGKGPVRLADIEWATLAFGQVGLYAFLVVIMLLLTTVNLLLTGVFLKDLVQWVRADDGYREFMTGPPARVTGVFVPVASLAMTMAVVFASVPFFVPAVSANVQMLVAPAFVVLVVLWLTAFGLESHLLARLRSGPFEAAKLNFVWLLDVFALGLLALAGTGLAAAADSRPMAATAALGSLLTLAVGSVLLVGKLAFLIYQQIKSRALPETQLQPAFFLLVPIICLYGVSSYRMMLLMETWFGVDVKAPSYSLLTLSYVAAAGWAAFTVYLLAGYFRRYFRTSEYFPTQWAMV